MTDYYGAFFSAMVNRQTAVKRPMQQIIAGYLMATAPAPDIGALVPPPTQYKQEANPSHAYKSPGRGRGPGWAM